MYYLNAAPGAFEVNTNNSLLFTVAFGPPEAEFVRPGAEEYVSLMIKYTNFLPNNLNIVSKARYTNGVFWMERFSDGYNPFSLKETAVSFDEIRRMRTVSELITYLGEPRAPIGGPVSSISHIRRWRVCNGLAGSDFRALDITAGSDAFSDELAVLVFRTGFIRKGLLATETR